MFSTDVLAVASIAGCAALSVGATARLLDAPHRMSGETECEFVVDDHFSNMAVSGRVIVFRSGDSHDLVVRTDGEAERCRKRRRRHRHRGEFEQTHEMQRALERAERARERAEQVRVRVMERSFEAESQAMEEAARALESAMEGEMRDRLEVEARGLDAEVRRMELREMERRERSSRRIRR